VKTTLEVIPRVKVRRSQAGFFIWVDLRAFMPAKATFANELCLFNELFVRAGVFILRGEVLGCAEPGWFRIVFSLSAPTMDQGLTRLNDMLNNYIVCNQLS
jgi:bifunctional pyridoxal-dependent enzyme with beta-cystathionase and maltose regulon repressor activities